MSSFTSRGNSNFILLVGGEERNKATIQYIIVLTGRDDIGGNSESTVFFKGYNIKKIGTLQLYIPDFQNDPGYLKQKDFLKSYEGHLK